MLDESTFALRAGAGLVILSLLIEPLTDASPYIQVHKTDYTAFDTRCPEYEYLASGYLGQNSISPAPTQECN